MVGHWSFIFFLASSLLWLYIEFGFISYIGMRTTIREGWVGCIIRTISVEMVNGAYFPLHTAVAGQQRISDRYSSIVIGEKWYG